MESGLKDRLTKDVEESIQDFADKMLVIATELPKVIFGIANITTFALSDDVVRKKFIETASVISNGWGKILHAYVDVGVAIADDIDSYEEVKVGFALRHPSMAMSINSEIKHVKKSWDRMKGSFAKPEPRTDDER